MNSLHLLYHLAWDLLTTVLPREWLPDQTMRGKDLETLMAVRPGSCLRTTGEIDDSPSRLLSLHQSLLP